MTAMQAKTNTEFAPVANVLELLAQELGVPASRLKTVLQASSKANSMDSVAIAGPQSARTMTITDDRPTREQFAHLAGVGLTLSEAAKKYDMPRHRIHHWAVERDYIKCVNPAMPAQYDEADIAFCVALVRWRRAHGVLTTDLFNRDGTPRYELVDQYRADWRKSRNKSRTKKK